MRHKLYIAFIHAAFIGDRPVFFTDNNISMQSYVCDVLDLGWDLQNIGEVHVENILACASTAKETFFQVPLW